MVRQLLAGIGARLLVDRRGKLGVFVLRALDAGAVPSARLSALNVVDVQPQALPASLDPPPYRWRVGWGRNHLVQTTDLNATVKDTARAQFLAAEYRYAAWSGTDVLTAYRRPGDPDPVPTALLAQSSAQALADSLGALWRGRPGLYAVTVPVAVAAALDIGSVVQPDLDAAGPGRRTARPGGRRTGALGRQHGGADRALPGGCVMANFCAAWRNQVLTGPVVVSSAAAAAMGGDQLQNDQGNAAAAWQTPAGTTSGTILLTRPAATRWRAFGVFRTNLTAAAVVTWMVGPPLSITPLVVPTDTQAGADSTNATRLGADNGGPGGPGAGVPQRHGRRLRRQGQCIRLQGRGDLHRGRVVPALQRRDHRGQRHYPCGISRAARWCRPGCRWRPSRTTASGATTRTASRPARRARAASCSSTTRGALDYAIAGASLSSPVAYTGSSAYSVVSGYGQSVLVAPGEVEGEAMQASISDPGNPDGFLNVPLMFAGPGWQGVRNYSYQSGPSREDGGATAQLRAGGVVVRSDWIWRTFDLSLAWHRGSGARPGRGPGLRGAARRQHPAGAEARRRGHPAPRPVRPVQAAGTHRLPDHEPAGYGPGGPRSRSACRCQPPSATWCWKAPTTLASARSTWPGAPLGRMTFVQMFGSGTPAFYVAHDGTQWEVGHGIVTAGSPNTLSRLLVGRNSAGTTAKVNFTGAVQVYSGVPADHVIAAGPDNATVPIEGRILTSLGAGTSQTDAAQLGQVGWRLAQPAVNVSQRHGSRGVQPADAVRQVPTGVAQRTASRGGGAVLPPVAGTGAIPSGAGPRITTLPCSAWLEPRRAPWRVARTTYSFATQTAENASGNMEFDMLALQFSGDGTVSQHWRPGRSVVQPRQHARPGLAAHALAVRPSGRGCACAGQGPLAGRGVLMAAQTIIVDGVPRALSAAMAQQLATAPAAPNTPGGRSSRVTPLEFMARFSEAESLAITAAATQSPELLRWFIRTAAGTYIDVLDPLTVEGVRALVRAGLLAPSRAEAILTP